MGRKRHIIDSNRALKGQAGQEWMMNGNLFKQQDKMEQLSGWMRKQMTNYYKQPRVRERQGGYVKFEDSISFIILFYLKALSWWAFSKKVRQYGISDEVV